MESKNEFYDHKIHNKPSLCFSTAQKGASLSAPPPLRPWNIKWVKNMLKCIQKGNVFLHCKNFKGLDKVNPWFKVLVRKQVYLVSIQFGNVNPVRKGVGWGGKLHHISSIF